MFAQDGTRYLAPQVQSQSETQECRQACGPYRGTPGALRRRIGYVSVPTRIVMPLQVANEGEPGRQTRHFRTIDEPPCQDPNQTGLLLNLSGGGDILGGLLKKTAMEKDVADQTAGVFEAWRDAQVVGLTVEEGAHIEVVQRERHWGNLNKNTPNA